MSELPRDRHYRLGPLRLIRWGTFGSWTLGAGSRTWEIHRAASGRRFRNGRRWLVLSRRWDARND